MNDKESTREIVSALMDGELDADQESAVTDRLTREVVLRQRWARYHLVRDVMRRDVQSTAGLELSVRVTGRLLDEPAHGPVRTLPARKRASLLRSPMAGLALAASVALVAVGVGSLYMADRPTANLTANLTAGLGAGAPASGALEPRPGDAPGALAAAPPPIVWVNHLQPAAQLSRLSWDAPERGVEDRLNGYLVSHSEYLGNGMRGMLPYARIVGYDGRQ